MTGNLRDIDIIGRKFGRLTAVSRYDKNGKSNSWRWLFSCECGGSVISRVDGVVHGKVRSCGCARAGTNRKAPGEFSFYRIYEQSRRAAIKRGILWSLTKEQHREIIQGNCDYCGEAPALYNPYLNKKTGAKRKETSQSTFDASWIHINGVDRQDNSIGYTVENSVPCCKPCNFAKWNRTVEEFLSHAKSIVKFQTLKDKKAA